MTTRPIRWERHTSSLGRRRCDVQEMRWAMANEMRRYAERSGGRV